MTLQDAVVAGIAGIAFIWLVRTRLVKKKACDQCGLVAAAAKKKPRSS